MRAPLLFASLLTFAAAPALAQEQPAAARQPAGQPAAARQPAGQPLSIADAMRMARENAESVRIAKAQLERSRAEVSRAQSALFPQVNGTASYQRTIESEFDGLFEPAPMDMDMDMDMGMGIDLPFGRRNTYRVGVTANQELFTGGRTTSSIDAAEAGAEQAEVALAEARAQAVLDATTAYYDAVLSRDLLLIAQITLEQAEETLAQTRLAFQQGAQPEFDVLRAEVTRDNQRTLVIQRASQLKLAMLALKQTIGLPLDERVELTSPLTEPAAQPVDTAARQVADIPADAIAPQTPIQRAEAQVRASNANIGLAASQRWPTLSVGADYGLVNYPEDLWPGTDGWRTNFTVGAFLNVPLFTGGRITAEIRSAEADLAQAEVRLEQAAELSALNTSQITEQVQVADAQWKASLRTIEQAERAYEIAQLRYSQGVSTQLELVDSRVLLEQARVNGALAARDLLVARVQLALLPSLPLSLGVPSAGQLATGGVVFETPAGPSAGGQLTPTTAGGISPSSGLTF